MSRHTIPLGRILGIPIGLDYSWFLIFGLLTWTLAVSHYPSEYVNWPTAQYWIVSAVTAVLFFLSVLLHELGHSVLALRYRISVRSITLFVFGGLSEIEAEPPSAVAEFWIAIAGPVVSFALAAFFCLLQLAVSGSVPLLALAKYLAYINSSLALFSLVPGFPLDGGRVFRAMVWGVTHSLRRATLTAASLGRKIACLFIFAGVWQTLHGDFGGGLWIVSVGWLLANAATSQIQRQRVHDRLAGHSVSQAMGDDCAAISAGTTLQQLVDRHILDGGQCSFVVDRGDKVVGLLTLHNIKETSPADRSTTTAAQVMIPVAQMKTVRPGTDLWAALADMDRDGVDQLSVMMDEHVLGVLSRGDVVSFMRTLRELGPDQA